MIGVFAVAVGLVGAVQAAAVQRTFVAPTGSDEHPCSLAQPCRGFAAALVQTSAGGEIVVLDSAGCGRVTINTSVTIAVPPGVHAGVTVFGGTNGVDIPTGGIKVVLRGVAITGQGGTDGIYVSGDNELAIERCDIGGMSGSGIHLDGVSGTVQIRDTVVHDNAANGVMLFGALSATLDRVEVERNTQSGLIVLEGAKVSARDSRFVRNNHGIEVDSFSVSGTSLTADGIAISDSTHEGLLAAASSGGFMYVRLVRSVLSHNKDVGVALKVTGALSLLQAMFADDAFADNGVGIDADVNPAVASSSGVNKILARNTFGEVQSVHKATPAGVLVFSAGGNSVVVGGGAITPDITTSF